MQPGRENGGRRVFARRGQAMIESCIVIIFLCLLFFGLFQMMHAYMARDVLDHAAARAARAKAVGFNRSMVKKTMRVAAIPNVGGLRWVSGHPPAPETVLARALATLSPGQLWDLALTNSPASPTIGDELNAIPSYLASGDDDRTILDYEGWNADSSIIRPIVGNIDIGAGVILDPDAGALISAKATQEHELLVALPVLEAGDIDDQQLHGHVDLIGYYQIEDHYSLYLVDLEPPPWDWTFP